MIAGFCILRKNKKNKKVDLAALESMMGIELPVLYKTFCSCFELGDSNLDWQEYLNPKSGYLNPSGSIKYEPMENKRELFFHGLFNLEELKQDWRTYSKSSKEYQEFGLLRIGDIGVGGGLFLGVSSDKTDKIFRVVWDWNENFELLANNIFEFIRDLIFVEDGANMEAYKYSQLYKNWGEDFWRVRED